MTVIVVGAGQAGLSTSYHLRKRGIEHVVLEAAGRVGEVWRSRWDSLRLFTPAQFDGLPGLPFPAPAGSYPTKDEMAAYLEAYARHFDLPLRFNARADRLSQVDGIFRLQVGAETVEAEQVVIATGSYRVANLPVFARDLAPSIKQLHAGDYRNPRQMRDGPALVVGAGNSGAEIAIELARAGHRTSLAGRSTGQVPVGAWTLAGGRPFWFLANHVLSIKTPLGRRLRANWLHHGQPLIRVSLKDIRCAGVEHRPRVVGTRDGHPLLADGAALEVRNVIWCTGFGQDFTWIDLPVLDASGLPRHHRGAVLERPGLYFVGLPFQTKIASHFIGGVGADAKTVVDLIERTAAGGARRAARMQTLRL